jgi:hypothetical protein
MRGVHHRPHADNVRVERYQRLGPSDNLPKRFRLPVRAELEAVKDGAAPSQAIAVENSPSHQHGHRDAKGLAPQIEDSSPQLAAAAEHAFRLDASKSASRDCCERVEEKRC